MESTSSLDFLGLAISFDTRVLEPRPWTEAQSAWAAELLAAAPEGPVLELCAGVGHIGLGAVRDSERYLVMVDRSPIAQRFAEENAAANGLASRVEFRLGAMEEALGEGERFALIVADPPWFDPQTRRSFLKTRCWPLTAARTDSPSLGSAWTSSTCT